MIDMKTELQNFKKINLDEIAASGQELSDNVRNSIQLYNKAVESLTGGSEDIAIIELKKAVSLNPHFYEALNLLGICYSYVNDNAKAAEIFDRVIRGENNGVLAQRYLGMVGAPEGETAKTRSARKNASSAGNTPAAPRKTVKEKPVSSTTGRLNILKYVACFAAGALFIGLISLISPKTPAKGTPYSTTAAAGNEKNTVQQANDYKAKYEEMAETNKQLQKNASDANIKADYYKNVIKLYEIESLAAAGKYEQAADTLLLVKTVEFTGGEGTKFKSLSTGLMPKAALIVYDDGRRFFNLKKYEDALKKLAKVQLFDPAFARLDAVMYYQGKSYMQLNDSRNAVAVFQKLITAYPNSTYAAYSKQKIARLVDQP